DWVGSTLRYNQKSWQLIDSKDRIQYRQDCSGYASLALRGSNCWTTVQIHSIATIPISKDELRPGDLINNKAPGNSGHVIIFERWANEDRESYWGYDFSRLGILYRQVSYPFRGQSGYEPRRYKNVCVEDSRFVAQSDYPTVAPGERFRVWFELENNGTCTWQDNYNYRLANVNDTNLGVSDAAVVGAVAPGERQRWTLDMIAPDAPGEYVTEWRLSHDGYLFGSAPWIRVTVVDSVPAGAADDRADGANRLNPNEWQEHAISPSGDVDWFTFRLDGPTTILVKTDGEEGDTVMGLFNSNWERIGENDDDTYDGTRFSRIDLSCLSAGQYYVGVSGYDNTTVNDYAVYYLPIEECGSSSDGRADNGGSEQGDPSPPVSEPLPQPTVTRYNVDPGRFICSDIIGLELIPWHNERRVDFNVAKCDFSPIRVSGRLFIVADNGSRIGPIYYSAGDVILSGFFDPIGDLGLAGWHQWEAHVYPDGQDYPIESPSQAMWEETE
ncbi:MAG: DVUA0089 family protein, partial [Caldilinea sp.]